MEYTLTFKFNKNEISLLSSLLSPANDSTTYRCTNSYCNNIISANNESNGNINNEDVDNVDDVINNLEIKNIKGRSIAR